MNTNMQENYSLLPKRVLDTLNRTDLEDIKSKLQRIKESTICTGVGGSKVVSDYASAILEYKNNITTTSCEPQTLLSKNLTPYQNVLVCSYSGNNYGVTMSLSNNLTPYILSSTPIDNAINLTYLSTYPKEKSFISLAATLMPMSILLAYYLDNDINIIEEILKETSSYIIKPSPVYEIISSSNPNAPESFLESTLTESGIAIPIIHGKYGYCHGRTTISKSSNHSLILFDNHTELDELLKQELPPYYQQIIILKSKYQDPLIDKFYLTYQSMYLAKQIAESTNKDLSNVDYSPLVKKLYKFKGSM